MTKDEAKEFLREFLKDRPNFREEHPGQDEEVYRQMDRLAEALDMAIDALGKDTDVPSSNLISRQAREYAKAVFVWLLDYQIKAAELKGRYTPYEVLSWVANDWRKENE